MLTHMDRYTAALLVVGMYACCNGQSEVQSPWPEERGLIFTILNRYGWRSTVHMRHLPIYPGYESFSGRIPGVNFTNSNINFRSIDVDFRTKCIYMYEYHLRSIVIGTGYSKDMTTSNMKFQHLHMGVSRGNIQVAVDWLSHTVYWSDSVFRWIVAANGHINKTDLDYHKIIADTHLDKPDGLTVDPLEGYLFWSDNGKHPKIERSDLMGKNRHTIYTKHLESPLTLEADIFGKRIYWVDDVKESILSTTYNGEDAISIQRIPNSVLFDLAIFREVIYISDVRNGNVYTLNKTKGIHLGKAESTVIRIFPETIYGLAVYGEENQPLKDKDYCAEKNCDHICVSTKTGAECICSEGYKKNETSGRCQEMHEGFLKAIVVANKTHICLTDIRSFARTEYEYVCKFTVTQELSTSVSPSTARTTTPWDTTVRSHTSSTDWSRRTNKTRPTTMTMVDMTTIDMTTVPPPEAPVDFIKMFDMDMENKIFFIATEGNTIYKRPIYLPIENDVKETIVTTSGIISGLAYDAEDTDNLYWCESNTKSVWVVNVVTKASKVIKRSISNPKDIVVVLEHRVLAMITGTNTDTYITTMTMDGFNVTNITRGRQKISAFTFDNHKRLFYYIVGRYLYSTTYNRTITNTIFYSVPNDAFNLVLYQNYLVWVHISKTNEQYVTSYDVNIKRIFRDAGVANSSVIIVDMKVLDQRLQSTNITSPCAYEDGGCSQICITHYTNDKMTPVCECRLGYTLDDDNVTCISTDVADDNFLLVADWTSNELLQISLENDNISAIPNSNNDDYRGVFIDVHTKKIIWSEYFDNNIYTANLNGTDQRILSDIGRSGYPYRFDKDMTTGNLYFTAYYSSIIGVLTPTGDTIVLNTVSSWVSVGDIVVHPGKGFMYYTVFSYRSKHVGRADMDGENSVELISGNHVVKPEGLAIDFINDDLYWSDSKYDTIQRCNLAGEDCVTIVNMTGTYQYEEIKDLVTDGNYLYYSALRKDHVVRVELQPPYTRSVVGQSPGIGKLDTIAYYSSTNINVQAVSDGCKAHNGLGDCSTICFPTQIGRSCACEKGVSLKADGRTCANIYQCTDLIQQTVLLSGNKIDEIDVTFDSSCLRHLDDKCRYRCPENFEPLFDTILTCTNVGWDLESKKLCEERRCPPLIDNGKLDSNCTREVGWPCGYQCNKGYIKTSENVVCTQNGTYHIPKDELCTEVQCPSTVPNGEIIGTCRRLIGETCEFRCNGGFRAVSSHLKTTCNSTGHWGVPDNACIEIRCPDTIDNGKLNSLCQRKVGDKCSYECNDGFMITRENVVCTGNGTYHIPANGLCMKLRCNDTIENGELSENCARTFGDTCTYKCNKYYSPRFNNLLVTCQVDGGWLPDSSTLCKESVCESNALANGNVIGKCSSKVGDTCAFLCNQGFINTTNVAVCSDDLVWHPMDACIDFKCSNTIENGKLGADCAGTLGDTCMYTCNKYFSPSSRNRQVTCQADGWNSNSSTLCKESVCSNTSLTSGNIIRKCLSKVGDTCNFQCTQGFANTTDVVECLDDLLWHPKDACAAYTCGDQIQNGALEDGCTRTIGASCTFSCNKYFKPNIATKLITCSATGWNPGITGLCKESVCDDKTLTHGRTTGPCTSQIGETCMLQCEKGYVNTTDKVVCQGDSTWHPSDSCTTFTCSGEIENGRLDPGCARTVGSTCKYSCNKYYTPSVKDFQIRCQADGWSPLSTNLCRVSVCDDFPHGKLIGTCSKTIGEVCEFQCDTGYANTTDLVVCKSDEMWHPRESCKVVMCPATVPGGEITGACDFSIGAKCTYKCNANFIANELHQSITCNNSGQWGASAELCLVSECKDSSLSNGKLTGNCKKMVGETCSVACNEGFVNTTSVAICRNDYMWHPMESCIRIRCSPYIPNGEIIGACDLAVGDTCNFTCYRDFKATDLHRNITCTASGHWSITHDLCIESISVAAKSSSLTGLPVPGVAAGITILLLTVFALIGAILFLYLRRRRDIPPSLKIKSPFRHNRNTAFENPGYNQNTDAPVETTDIDVAQMQPMSYTEGASSSEAGNTNSINNNEPLPEVAHIDITNDTAVLTHDSWQREKFYQDTDKY